MQKERSRESAKVAQLLRDAGYSVTKIAGLMRRSRMQDGRYQEPG